MDVDNAPQIRTSLVPVRDSPAQRIGQHYLKGGGFQSASVATLLAFIIIVPVTVGVGLLVFHVLAHGSIGTFERSLSRWLSLHRTKVWNHWSYEATYVGSSIPVAIIAFVITAFLLIRHWGRQALILLFGLIIELGVFLAANYIVRRPRPSIRHVGVTPSTYSFPSGHAAASVVLYGSIAVIVCIATKHLVPRIAAWTFALAMIVAIGISRIYRGDHYLTDVIGGILVGLASLYAGLFITRVIVATELARDPKKAQAIEEHVATAGEPS